MKKILLLTLTFLFSFNLFLVAEEDVMGLWKTIDDKTGKARSIIAVYEYQGKVYGRLIATYDDAGKEIMETLNTPKDRAPGVEGDPYYVGLDIIWDLKKEDGKYLNGKVMDPEKGRVYNAEMWRKNDNLIMRGQILLFGVKLGSNQEWLPVRDSELPTNFPKPDLAALVPSVQKVKKAHAKSK